MKNKSALFGMLSTTLIFAFLLLIGMARVDPRTARLTGFVFITAALFLFLWSLIGTILLSVRRLRKKDRYMAISLRQASFFSIIVVIALYFQRFNLLTWWNIFLLIALVVVIEIFFISKEQVGGL